jgi:hypothetical protein
VTFFIQGLPMPSIKLGGEVLEIIDPMNIQPVSADQSPNVIAAGLLAAVCANCSRSDFTEGNGYCGTMATALVALRGLLPGLSGLIREHAALLVNNPTLPLSAMPFAPV